MPTKNTSCRSVLSEFIYEPCSSLLVWLQPFVAIFPYRRTCARLGWSVLPVALFHSEHPQLKKATHPPHCLVQKQLQVSTVPCVAYSRATRDLDFRRLMKNVAGFLRSWGSFYVACWVFWKTFPVTWKVFAFFGGTSSRMTIFVGKKPSGVPLLNHQATNQSTIKLSQQLEGKNVSFSKF